MLKQTPPVSVRITLFLTVRRLLTGPLFKSWIKLFLTARRLLTRAFASIIGWSYFWLPTFVAGGLCFDHWMTFFLTVRRLLLAAFASIIGWRYFWMPDVYCWRLLLRSLDENIFDCPTYIAGGLCFVHWIKIFFIPATEVGYWRAEFSRRNYCNYIGVNDVCKVEIIATI